MNRKHLSTKRQGRKWRGSIIIESSIIVPTCLFFFFFCIRIGILLYDTHTMSITTHHYVNSELTSGKEWWPGLRTALYKRMIVHKPISRKNLSAGKYLVTMKYNSFWRINILVEEPSDQRGKLYHMLNGKQLIEHIPTLQKVRDGYLDALDKLRKD